MILLAIMVTGYFKDRHEGECSKGVFHGKVTFYEYVKIDYDVNIVKWY